MSSISLKQCALSIVILFVLLVQCKMSTGKQFKRVCYLRPEQNFPVESVIHLELCTHIIIAFVEINGDSSLSFKPSLAHFTKYVRQIIDQNSSNVKLMFSVGGGGVGGWEMASSTGENRKRFVAACFEFIQNYNLDGIDIDWEFPAFPRAISKYYERDNFVYLLQELREQFDKFEASTGKHLFLSCAVAGQLSIIRVSYRPTEIAKYVDFINLMTYDYNIHKWYWPFVGHNSPLHFRNMDIGLMKTGNVRWAANYWNTIGLHKSQIMVGIPTYGKRYILYSKYFNVPGSWAIRGEEDISYSEACDFLRRNGTVLKFDFEAHVPYAHNGQEWISFENELSAYKKAEWIRINQFGGAMLFSLNADDFKRRCPGNRIFPIHTTVRDVLLSPM